MLCCWLNKSVYNFYLLRLISFYNPSLPLLSCASHLKHNVRSDVLSSFQTQILFVSGACIKSVQEDSEMEEFHWTETPEEPEGWKEFCHFSYSELQPLSLLLFYVMYSFSFPLPFWLK